MVVDPFDFGDVVFTRLPEDAVPMTEAEIRAFVADRVVITPFPEYEKIAVVIADGLTSDVEAFDSADGWRQVRHYYSRFDEGTYSVSEGELCVRREDADPPLLRCRAFFRTVDGSVFTRRTSDDGVVLPPSEQPALKVSTKSMEWLAREMGEDH